MVPIISLLLAISVYGSDLLLVTGAQTTEQVPRHEPHFLYDNHQNFEKIPATAVSVDSLLAIANEQRSRDAGISFNAARQALSISNDIGYKKGEAEAYNVIGLKYLDFGDHELAHIYYLRALSIEEQRNNKSGIATILSNIARVFLEQNNHEEAIKYLESSTELWKELENDRQILSSTNNLGVIHRRQGNYDKALDYFWDTAERSMNEEADSLRYIIATLNIGNTYRNKGDFTRGKIHLHAAREYLDRHRYISHLIFTDIALGKLYKSLEEYNTALDHAFSALSMAEKEGYRESIKKARLLIAEIHERLGQYEMAFNQFRLYHQISDTLQTMQRGERINELQARFDVEQKDREIELLNKEAALKEAKIIQNDQLKSFLISGVLLLLIIVSLLYRANRQKKRSNYELNNNRIEIEKKNKTLSILNKEKDEFLSVAAHDLRNPLSSINMAADLIRDENDINKKTLDEYTSLIKLSTARMLNLINSLLDIQSISNHSDHTHFQKLNANQLSQEAVKHFSRSAESKGIQLKLILSEDNPVIRGNADNVLRIFDNLISNAIKYSPVNTIVTIATNVKSKVVQISVSDQGPGINKEDRTKLFGKFARLSNKPTANESSTGLGLFIVKKITSSMGGKVWCESEPGAGSVFYVELPVYTAEKKRPPVKIRKNTATKL